MSSPCMYCGCSIDTISVKGTDYHECRSAEECRIRIAHLFGATIAFNKDIVMSLHDILKELVSVSSRIKGNVPISPEVMHAFRLVYPDLNIGCTCGNCDKESTIGQIFNALNFN